MLVFILQLKLTEEEFEFRVSSLFVINQTERNSFDQNQKRPTRKSVVFLIIFIRVFFFSIYMRRQETVKIFGTVVTCLFKGLLYPCFVCACYKHIHVGYPSWCPLRRGMRSQKVFLI